MQNILITGGAGFIGSHTADELLRRGYRVRVLDILDPQIHEMAGMRPDYLDERIEFLLGDVRKREDMARAVEGVDAVFHLASITGVGQSMYDMHRYFDVNVNGTAMLLDVLANTPNQVRKIVLSSSRAVYGEGKYKCGRCGIVFPQARKREQMEMHQWDIGCPNCREAVAPLPTDEDKPLNPISVYALTKKVQEEMLRIFSETYKVPSVILRYFNVYGTRQAINNPYTGIGAIFTNRSLSGEHISIYEDGRSGRDFVNVRDVVQANILALENSRADNGVFNVGSGERMTILDLAKLIKKKLESTVEIKFTNQFRVGDIRDCYADIYKSRDVLGYRPAVGFEEGVEELIEWAKGKRIEDRFSEAEDALKKRKLI